MPQNAKESNPSVEIRDGMVLITNSVDLYEYENNTYIQTFKSILYYKQSEHPTCTCFGHSCGHPQGGC